MNRVEVENVIQKRQLGKKKRLYSAVCSMEISSVGGVPKTQTLAIQVMKHLFRKANATFHSTDEFKHY